VDEWATELARVDRLNQTAQPADAERVILRVITEAPSPDLDRLSDELDRLIAQFFPKRRARILQARSVSPSNRGEAVSQPGRTPDDLHATTAARSAQHEVGGSASPSSIADALANIAKLQQSIKMDEAERALTDLAKGLTRADFETNKLALHRLVDQFLPKRQKSALAALNEREKILSRIHDQGTPRENQAPTPPIVKKALLPATPSNIARGQQSLVASHTDIRVLGRTPVAPNRVSVTRERFQSDLSGLGRFHIFQWATYYRDTLADYFDSFLDELESSTSTEILDLVRSCLSSHSREIFRKGFVHVTGSTNDDRSYAVTKSLSGLQRFLDLPLEFYSSTLQARRAERSAALRKLCSAMLCGILQGYAAAEFDVPGGHLLPRFPRSWAHTLPFLTTADLDELMPALEAGDFVEGIYDSVRPVVSALDQFIDAEPAFAPLPALSQFLQSYRRLDVSLQLPPERGARTFELQCWMSGQFISADSIEEATARAVDVVVAPLRSDLRARVESVERWSSRVVPVLNVGDTDPSRRLLARLQDIVHETQKDRLDRPITFNWVETFPLENPSLIKYNHVYRSSVRRLMQSHERRNGVRLWCSVRRSGKTTACRTDLGSTSSGSIMLAQT
jgi:hypothetical protein